MNNFFLVCLLFFVISVTHAKSNEITNTDKIPEQNVVADKDKAKQEKTKERKKKAKCKSNSRSTGSRIKSRC